MAVGQHKLVVCEQINDIFPAAPLIASSSPLLRSLLSRRHPLRFSARGLTAGLLCVTGIVCRWGLRVLTDGESAVCVLGLHRGLRVLTDGESAVNVGGLRGRGRGGVSVGGLRGGLARWG